MGKVKIGCKYPLCINYKCDAKTYCGNGCAWDHTDYIRLGLGRKKNKIAPSKKKGA